MEKWGRSGRRVIGSIRKDKDRSVLLTIRFLPNREENFPIVFLSVRSGFLCARFCCLLCFFPKGFLRVTSASPCLRGDIWFSVAALLLCVHLCLISGEPVVLPQKV